MNKKLEVVNLTEQNQYNKDFCNFSRTLKANNRTAIKCACFKT